MFKKCIYVIIFFYILFFFTPGITQTVYCSTSSIEIINDNKNINSSGFLKQEIKDGLSDIDSFQLTVTTDPQTSWRIKAIVETRGIITEDTGEIEIENANINGNDLPVKFLEFKDDEGQWVSDDGSGVVIYKGTSSVEDKQITIECRLNFDSSVNINSNNYEYSVKFILQEQE